MGGSSAGLFLATFLRHRLEAALFCFALLAAMATAKVLLSSAACIDCMDCGLVGVKGTPAKYAPVSILTYPQVHKSSYP
jgi:hypothetical protein